MKKPTQGFSATTLSHIYLADWKSLLTNNNIEHIEYVLPTFPPTNYVVAFKDNTTWYFLSNQPYSLSTLSDLRIVQKFQEKLALLDSEAGIPWADIVSSTQTLELLTLETPITIKKQDREVSLTLNELFRFCLVIMGRAEGLLYLFSLWFLPHTLGWSATKGSFLLIWLTI